MSSQDIQALKYTVAHAMLNPLLEWRHHGIGLLQAYLHEGEDETRIHIWHPKLVLGEFTAENGLVHDHRFSFKSWVLAGALYHERFDTFVSFFGEWVMHECEHARSAKEKTGSYNLPLGRRSDSQYAVTRRGEWINAGESYEFEARKFHNTTVKELTVTLVQKRGLVDGNARILAKKGTELIHAFSDSLSHEEFKSYIYEAANQLGQRYV